IVLGAVIALAWAGPAAIAGGTKFAYMLFVGQTTERVVEALWHERPWWWYLPVAFLLVFPWLWWIELWRGLTVRGLLREPGLRFCWAMFVPVFAAFPATSGKTPLYVLPMIPVFALGAARLLVATADLDRFGDRRFWRAIPLLPVVAIGAILIAGTLFPDGLVV